MNKENVKLKMTGSIWQDLSKVCLNSINKKHKLKMKGLKVLYNTLTIKLKDKPHSPGTDG